MCPGEVTESNQKRSVWRSGHGASQCLLPSSMGASRAGGFQEQVLASDKPSSLV